MTIRNHSSKRPTGSDAYRDGSGGFVPEETNIVDGAALSARQIDCDVCVIGTGAGGAPVAKELAEGGREVVMLEEGGYHTTDDFDGRHSNMFSKLYRDSGQTITVGNPPIMMPLGRTVGGTSLINSGTCFRTPDSVLQSWQKEFGLIDLTSELLDPYFRRVEREINVTQVPPELAGKNAQVVKRGADKLGYSGDYIYRNVRGCVGSGVCTAGCPTSAKQHVGITYVPKAWQAGATTYTGCRAQSLIVDGERVVAVEAKTASGPLRVNCEAAVVAAGTVHTPLLLRHCGIGGESGQLGHNLTIHPAYAMRALFDEEIGMTDGVPQSYYVDQFADQGIMFEGAAVPPGLAAATMPYYGRRHHELMRNYRNLSVFGAMVSDTGSGSVSSIRGQTVVRYSLSKQDLERYKKAIVTLAEIYWAAGAKAVYPGIESVAELKNGEIDRLRDCRIAAADLPLMAFHPLGTCRMGSDPSSSVVDSNLKAHSLENLYVSDGSVVPSSLGVNPQITIMTLATRLAYHLLGAPAPLDEPEPEKIAQPRVLAH